MSGKQLKYRINRVKPQPWGVTDTDCGDKMLRPLFCSWVVLIILTVRKKAACVRLWTTWFRSARSTTHEYDNENFIDDDWIKTRFDKQSCWISYASQFTDNELEITTVIPPFSRKCPKDDTVWRWNMI